MLVVNSITEIHVVLEKYRALSKSIGLVPTMGALHQGHLALVEEALRQNDITVVSIFVNPTQFDKVEDLDKYPRTLERDVALLETISKKRIVVFAPLVKEVYNDQIVATPYSFGGLEFEMEGKFRKGHFDGVGTIVQRLFEIVKPEHAYFGEKDFQQLQIIRKLVELYHIPVIIVGCKIHREANGLAMSSRNERLKPEYRREAPFIYLTLKSAKAMFGTESASKVSKWVADQFEMNKLLELEYFAIADEKTLKTIKRKSKKKKYRAFIAVYADNIRLIDNIALN